MRVCRFEPLARTRSAENTTSSAVKGSPLWNLTPLRRWKRQRVGSGVSQLSASAGNDLEVLVAGDQAFIDMPEMGDG